MKERERERLHAAMIRIAGQRGLMGYSAVYGPGRRGETEAIAHELAHALDLGADFEAHLYEMGDVEANEHELSTLKIEHAGLAAFGMRTSMRSLVATANWRDICKPTLADANLPLTLHEQRCVRRFVNVVKTNMEVP